MAEFVPPPAPPTGAPTPPLIRPRVLVRGDVIFCPPADQPDEAADLSAEWETVPEAEPIQRTVTVGTAWQPVLRGLESWTDDWGAPPSLVVVENLHGLDRQVIPTPEERAADAARVLLVTSRPTSTDPASVAALVRPGRTLPVEPANPLWIRCPAGPVRARIAALPPTFRPASPAPRPPVPDDVLGDRPPDHPYREA